MYERGTGRRNSGRKCSDHLAILKGEDRGPKRQAVVMNAGAGLYVAEKASSLEEGVRRAEALIDSGRAYAKLKEFIQYSNQS